MKQSAQRILFCSGIAVVCGHVTILILYGVRAPGPLWSNILQFLLGALAAVMATICTSEGDPASKCLWRLIATGLWMWTCGQGLLTFSDYILHRPLHSDHLLFFWPFAFLVAALKIDAIDWTLVLDVAQIFIIALVLDVFLFGPDYWGQAGAASLDLFRWKARLARDLVVIVAILLRWHLSVTPQTRWIYSRIALVFVAYMVADGTYLYGQIFWNFRAGQFWELLWTAPRAIALLVAFLWRPDRATAQRSRLSLRPSHLILRTIPLFVPLFVLLLAGALVRHAYVLTLFLVVASMICAGVRSLIAQHNEASISKELHSSNEQLGEWKSRYDDALIASGRVVYEWDVLTDSITYSSSLQPNFGLSPETLGQDHASWVERIHPDDRAKYAESLCRALEELRRFDCEYRVRLGGADFRVVSDIANVRHIPESGRCHLTGILSDITERRTLQQQIYAAQRIESIGTLSGGIAHDFNNLITVIQGFCEMAEQRIADEQAKKDLAEVRGAAARAAALTRQLLAFSRRQVLQPQVVQVDRIIEDMHKMLNRLIGENITFVTHVTPDVGDVYVDPAQLEQVIMNLVVNARDAMVRGGTLTIEAANTEFDEHSSQTHFGAPPGTYVTISVTDTGEGIPPEMQTRIFDPFFTTKPVGQGTGLGLATVYGIVKQSQGYITCYSEVGLGTTFKVYFPISTRTEKANQKPKHSTVPVLGQPGDHTVLLAEDDKHVRQFTEKVLTGLGYNVLSADGPAMAQYLARGSAAPVKALVTDLVMPGCSGQELAACIRAIHPNIRVLYISGYSESAYQGKFASNERFLSKPFSGHALGITLRELITTS